MELTGASIDLYVRHAFGGMSRVLDRLDAAAVDRTSALVEEFLAGRTVTDHPFRDFMPGEDRTDGALVLHVLEELLQHLGHMEVTADALVGSH
jgi:hypothetical protein